MKYLNRLTLAKDFANALQGKKAFNDAPNGLFLAAPRRTGKSSFLQNDLKPVLEEAGALVVYVDLWAYQEVDPTVLMKKSLMLELEKSLGTIASAAIKSGLKEFGIGPFKFSTQNITMPKLESASFADILKTLREVSKKPVAFIIDEAQQSLASKDGEKAMFALKSARDQMNIKDEINLMLIMSGSDRDKLLRLVNTNSAPFLGSKIQSMPTLGYEFIDHVANMIVQEYPNLEIDNKKLLTAFSLFDFRPQFFQEAIGDILNPLNALDLKFFNDILIERGEQEKEAAENQMESDFLALKPLEKAILWRILEMKENYKPYDASSIAFYSQVVSSGKNQLTRTQIQKSLNELRESDPSLIWKSERGEYAVENSAMLNWFQRRVKENKWPPLVSTLKPKM